MPVEGVLRFLRAHLGFSGSRSAFSDGFCGDNHQAQPPIYSPINGRGNYQQTDADECKSNEMKNDKCNEELKENRAVINRREWCPFG